MLAALPEDGLTRSDIADQLAVHVDELDELVFGLVLTALAGDAQAQSRPRRPVLQVIEGRAGMPHQSGWAHKLALGPQYGLHRNDSPARALEDQEAVEMATLEWAAWFNNHRLLGSIGYVPPAEAEAKSYKQQSSLASRFRASDWQNQKE